MLLAENEVRELAYLCAGIGSGCVMRLTPDVVMPTEDIIEAIESLLGDYIPKHGGFLDD